MLTFLKAKEFFMSWGLFPHGEPTEPYSEEEIQDGITAACFNKLVLEAASLYGQPFAQFCFRQIDATDGHFYLPMETWEELEEAYKKAFP